MKKPEDRAAPKGSRSWPVDVLCFYGRERLGPELTLRERRWPTTFRESGRSYIHTRHNGQQAPHCTARLFSSKGWQRSKIELRPVVGSSIYRAGGAKEIRGRGDATHSDVIPAKAGICPSQRAATTAKSLKIFSDPCRLVFGSPRVWTEPRLREDDESDARGCCL